MTVAAEEDGVSEDGLDYLASLFQNADYKQIMQVGSYFLYWLNLTKSLKNQCLIPYIIVSY